MTTSSTPTPGDDRRRDMSPDEKLIAQWEAQHDVAARGHRGDPLGLQRSLSRERLVEQCRPPRGATARGQSTAAPQPPMSGPGPADEAPHAQAPRVRRHPWWRLHHHTSEH
jgi:hypothetical protein